MSHGGLKLEIANSGRVSAESITIELAHKLREELFKIDKLDFIPPKRHELHNQWKFTMISLTDAILPGEKITVIIHSDIKHDEYPYLWIRIVSNEGEAHRICFNFREVH